MKWFITMAVLALAACGVQGVSTEQPLSGPPLQHQVQKIYNPGNDGDVWLVEQGEHAWPAIAGAIMHYLASGDSYPVKYAKNFGMTERVTWNTKAVFISYHLWNTDGHTVVQMIEALHAYPEAAIKVYVYSPNPAVEATVLAAGADGFILIPDAPDITPEHSNMLQFGDLAYRAVYGVPPPPAE